MNPAEAKNISRNLNLPQLVGRPDQIQQAEQIRAEKLEQVLVFEKNWEMFLNQLEASSLADNSLLHLKQADEASFWIENQHLEFWELLTLFN